MRKFGQSCWVSTAPGVYLFKDARSEVLYIGKAKSLRGRVRTYFNKSGDTRQGIGRLLDRVRDVDVIVTSTGPRRSTSSRTSSSGTGRPSTSGSGTTSRFHI